MVWESEELNYSLRFSSSKLCDLGQISLLIGKPGDWTTSLRALPAETSWHQDFTGLFLSLFAFSPHVDKLSIHLLFLPGGVVWRSAYSRHLLDAFKNTRQAWLEWLSGLSAGLQTTCLVPSQGARLGFRARLRTCESQPINETSQGPCGHPGPRICGIWQKG